MSEMFGVVAQFDSPKTVLKAAKKVKEAGYTCFDAHSPFPIHGMDAAMGLGDSKLGIIVFCGGIVGLSVGMGLQGWASAIAYPLTISGKPLFSFQAFIPVTFELMILFAAFATVFGMFALNKLPTWYHAIFKHSTFSEVTTDGFFISIEAKDPIYDEATVTALLADLGGRNIESVEA